MERYYHIAGLGFRVTGREEEFYQNDRVLSPFRTEVPQWDLAVQMEIVEHLPSPEGEMIFSDGGRVVYRNGQTQLSYNGDCPEHASMCICRRGSETLAQVMRSSIPNRLVSKLALTAMELEHRIVEARGFLLHASYVRHGDGAILFTAPSGTGKSTQAELWCRLRDAELINGDRVAVMQTSDGFLAWGVPYSGSSGVSKNVTLPVKAIVYLSQAKTTTIQPLRGVRAFRHLWEGCCANVWNREDVEHCTQTVSNAVQRVPVFHLACTPDESAVRALEDAMKQTR